MAPTSVTLVAATPGPQKIKQPDRFASPKGTLGRTPACGFFYTDCAAVEINPRAVGWGTGITKKHETISQHGRDSAIPYNKKHQSIDR